MKKQKLGLKTKKHKQHYKKRKKNCLIEELNGNFKEKAGNVRVYFESLSNIYSEYWDTETPLNVKSEYLLMVKLLEKMVRCLPSPKSRN